MRRYRFALAIIDRRHGQPDVRTRCFTDPSEFARAIEQLMALRDCHLEEVTTTTVTLFPESQGSLFDDQEPASASGDGQAGGAPSPEAKPPPARGEATDELYRPPDAGEPVEEAMTDEQWTLLEKLLRSHVWTAEERAETLRRARRWTKRAASSRIDRVMRTLKERKAQEVLQADYDEADWEEDAPFADEAQHA